MVDIIVCIAALSKSFCVVGGGSACRKSLCGKYHAKC
jgi:hypothetical protein